MPVRGHPVVLGEGLLHRRLLHYVLDRQLNFVSRTTGPFPGGHHGDSSFLDAGGCIRCHSHGGVEDAVDLQVLPQVFGNPFRGARRRKLSAREGALFELRRAFGDQVRGEGHMRTRGLRGDLWGTVRSPAQHIVEDQTSIASACDAHHANIRCC